MQSEKFKSSRLTLWLCVAVMVLYAMPRTWQRGLWYMTAGRIWKPTVESRLADLQPYVMARLGNPATPAKLWLVAYKTERKLDVFTEDNAGKISFLKRYTVFAASGTNGPKLREGDKQVPEGKYAIESLHPASICHLALKVAYPSAEDVRCAQLDGRDAATLGGNIMIHGQSPSRGCIALLDRDIEEIFVLAALTGTENVTLLVYPWNFKYYGIPKVDKPEWLKERYAMLDAERQRFPER